MNQGTDFASEDLESEVVQLQGTLEERKYELRQRNFSPIRATEIISMLNGKLEETQTIAARARAVAEREAEAQVQERLEK